MPEYWKCTRLDGTDFLSGMVDYGAALVSGEIIRHPEATKVRNQPETYLSVSVSAADCIGFSWPCRLFRVEPVGRIMGAGKVPLVASPSKRAVSALRVVEELPAWQALGPNGEAVAALIERCRTLTADDIWKLGAAADAAADAAWDAAWDAARAAARAAAADAAWVAAWGAARAAARGAAGVAAWDAAADAAWVAAWGAARAAARGAAGVAAWDAARGAARGAAADAAADAAWAFIVRDLITPEQFRLLAGPWIDVMGEGA